jgi:hypothetical protein
MDSVKLNSPCRCGVRAPSDDDDDPPPTTKSQDSKNYAKNLTIAGGQSRKRRTPPKPRNL